MALRKCPECGNEISSMARNCPHCGFEVAKQEAIACTGIGCLLTIVVLFVGWIINSLSGEEAKPPPTPTLNNAYSARNFPPSPAITNLPLDVYELKSGSIYKTTIRKTPLCPSPDPGKTQADTWNSISQIKFMPAGVKFRVLKKTKYKNDTWYGVEVLDYHMKGWFNCVALMSNVKEDR